MRAEILSIGTEILLGHITDTNATYLAQQLSGLGIDLYFVSQVGDNRGRVTQTLQKAWERADVIITTGGLGPTEDDVTREAIAELLHETPTIDPTLEADLRAKYVRFSQIMPESNRKQAWLIPSAQSMNNPVGTAPGWYVERDGHIIISMPGVPSEMYKMWQEQAVPRIAAKSGQTIFTRILRVAGIGESSAEELVADEIHLENPTVATYAKQDAVDLRISAKAATTEEARTMVDGVDATIRAKLGKAVFGVDKETLASVIGHMLIEHGWTIALMESCTGGLLASMITDVAGSSRYLRGSLVSYATEVKVELGIPATTIIDHGVISNETALAMARLACEKLGADVGIGITGVAGPDAQEDKPVGQVHVAIVSPAGEVVKELHLIGQRAEIKQRSALRALDLLRLHILGF